MIYLPVTALTSDRTNFIGSLVDAYLAGITTTAFTLFIQSRNCYSANEGIFIKITKHHNIVQPALIQTFFDKFISNEISIAFAEWVIAPTEILSTPVRATKGTFSSVIFPDASVSGKCVLPAGFQPLTILTASFNCSISILSNKIISMPALSASITSSSVLVSTSIKAPFLISRLNSDTAFSIAVT